MKPVTINLVVKKNIRDKVLLGFVVLFVFSTFGITLVNTVDYFANTKVIKTYELRIKEINKRSERKRAAVEKRNKDKKSDKKSKQDLSYLTGLIKKNLFPLPMVLTEIEKIKPAKIDINGLVFSDTLDTIIIRGESDYVGAVSDFIINMDRSSRFAVELSKEEIRENRRIVFELTARWINLKNDQKI